MRYMWIILFSLFACAVSQTSHAQKAPLGDILDDIINGRTSPNQTPIYGNTGINTIPVMIRFDVPGHLDDHTLIVSAYTPNDPSGKTIKSQLLGQNRIVLNGVKSPLQFAIATPEIITKNLTHTRITAEIRDENNNRVMTNEREGLYRGTEPPEITLIATGFVAESIPTPQITGFEVIQGDVFIRNKRHTPAEGFLTLQLIENALLGGTSITIAAEKTIPLDKNYPPYGFNLERGFTTESQKTPLSLKAWITDWAGRKTHVLRTPIAYNGPNSHYKLTLDAITQGLNTEAGRQLDPALMAQTLIQGDAVYDPSSGIPSGARLKATLSKSVGAFGENRVISQQTILMNSQQGSRIPFSLSAASTNFDPFIPAPILKLEILDSRGNIFYDSGDIRAAEGNQTIQLYARRN